jgi:hypothetical protein
VTDFALHWLWIGTCWWAVAAYLFLPFLWRHYHYQKRLDGRPMVTRTALGLAGDPINIGLVGTTEDVVAAMTAAGWHGADPVTLQSSVKIVSSVVLHHAYPDAPVSPLYYDGRVQDLAFEYPVGKSAKQRQHVRFWLVLPEGDEGRPVWLGAATFDRAVGFSHYTAQVTHHIAPDIDAARDFVIDTLVKAHKAEARYQITGVGPTLNGRNGGGDRYFTDGEIGFVRLATAHDLHQGPPTVLADPPMVSMKNALFQAIRPANSG